MAGTTVIALRSALKEAMQDNADLQNVSITYGQPGDRYKPEMIYFTKSSEVDTEPATMRAGRKRRQEDYAFDLVIHVSSRARPEDSETRAAEICGVVETLLADDVKVNNVVNLMWALPERIVIETFETGDKPVTTVTMTIRAVGRLL